MKKLLLVLVLVPFAVFAVSEKTQEMIDATKAKAQEMVDKTKALFTSDKKEVNISTADSANKLVEYFDLIQKEKDDWFNFCLEEHKAKIELMKKQHDEIFALKRKLIKEFKTGNTQDLYARELQKMIPLHNNHTQQWKELCQKLHEKGKKLYESHKAKFAQFEGTESIEENESTQETEESEMDQMSE